MVGRHDRDGGDVRAGAYRCPVSAASSRSLNWHGIGSAPSVTVKPMPMVESVTRLRWAYDVSRAGLPKIQTNDGNVCLGLEGHHCAHDFDAGVRLSNSACQGVTTAQEKRLAMLQVA